MEDFMKRFSIPVLGTGLVSAAMLAQSAPPPTPTPGDSAPAIRSSTAAGTVLLTGTVWKYAAGQSITIRTGDGKDHEMALQPGVRVDGSVVVGGLAALMWATDNAGNPRVMSITAPPGSAMDIERSAPSVGTYGTGTPRPNPAATTPGRTPRPKGTTTPGPRPDQYPTPGPSPRPTPAASSQ
jgi:hypothetical protein